METLVICLSLLTCYQVIVGKAVFLFSPHYWYMNNFPKKRNPEELSWPWNLLPVNVFICCSGTHVFGAMHDEEVWSCRASLLVERQTGLCWICIPYRSWRDVRSHPCRRKITAPLSDSLKILKRKSLRYCCKCERSRLEQTHFVICPWRTVGFNIFCYTRWYCALFNIIKMNRFLILAIGWSILWEGAVANIQQVFFYCWSICSLVIAAFLISAP